MPGLDASESQLLDLWLDLGTSNSILGVFRQEYRHTVENSDQLLDRTPRGYYQSRRRLATVNPRCVAGYASPFLRMRTFVPLRLWKS